jgi:hypothetical protein
VVKVRFTIPEMSMRAAKKGVFLQVLKVNREWVRIIEKKLFDSFETGLKKISLVDKKGADYFIWYWGFQAKSMRKDATAEDLIEAELCDKAVLNLLALSAVLQEAASGEIIDERTFDLGNKKIACFRNYLNHLEDFANKIVDFSTIKNEYSEKEMEEMRLQSEKFKKGKTI